MPFRQAVARRQERVRDILHTLPENAQVAIQDSFEESFGPYDDTEDFSIYEEPLESV